VLGDDVVITGGAAGYALEVTGDEIDAACFERLVREGEEALDRGASQGAAERLVAALSLWRGRPFGELADEGALRLEADRLEELRLRALEKRFDAELALGKSAELVEELEGLVRTHPYRERLWRQLMLGLYRAGRQADAIAAYTRARRQLVDALGVEPGEELRRLEQAILRQEVEVVKPAVQRHNLPAPVTSFIGREAELAELGRLLGEHRLLTLTGVGGAGKTRLALELAGRKVIDFPDGVYFVDFSGLADPGLVPRHVAAALEVHEQGDTDLAQLLVARLRERELLLLLDNCEHVLETCAELAHHLLSTAPKLRVFATSREPLGAPGELDYPVPPLALPPSDADADQRRSSEAVKLFLVRARAARPQLPDDDRAVTTAARICAELDGLPLALELAAARAKALSLEEIATRLSDRFRFLVSWRRLSAARHRTLREAMDWSYELLSAEEQELLARLSVFAGGFTLQAAARVCVNGDEERAIDLMDRLVNASLVVAEEHEGEMRYRLLETVRQYGAERLDQTGAESADGVRGAHARFFVELAESVELRGPEQQHGFAQVGADLDNLRGALDFAAAIRDVETELRLVSALWRYWLVRGYLVEGRERAEDAVSRGADAAENLYLRALFGAGMLAWSIGDYPRGRTVGTQLLHRANATGSLADAHAATKLLGMITLREREYAESVSYARQTLALAEKLGNEADILIGRLNLAVGIMDSGEVEEALPMFEEVLVDYRQSGIAEGIGLALLNIGEAACILGDNTRARTSFEEAGDAFASIGYRAHVGHALQGLAGVEARSGNYVEAAQLLGRAESVLKEVNASKDDFAPWLAAEAEAETRAQLGDAGFAAAFDEGRRPKPAIV
jgi:predicted ATPase